MGAFTRRNIIKLWPFSLYDLTSIGVRDLLPGLGCQQVHFVPIADLSHALLRVCLVLGVRVHIGCGVSGLTEGGSKLVTDNAALNDMTFHAIFDASGTAASLRESAGIDCEVHQKEIWAVTMNFQRFGTSQENAFFKKLSKTPAKYGTADSHFNSSEQFEKKTFLSKKVRISNIAYFRGSRTHYTVFTVPRETVLGILARPPLANEVADITKSVDFNKLAGLGLQVAADWNIPHSHSGGLESYALNGQHKPDICIFNYGDSYKARSVVKFLGATLFGLLGDSIETPFWPHGTGANKAIYSAHLQALVMIFAVRRRDQPATLTFAKALKQKMSALSITGNDTAFSSTDYASLVRQMYEKTSRDQIPDFDA